MNALWFIYAHIQLGVSIKLYLIIFKNGPILKFLKLQILIMLINPCGAELFVYFSFIKI